jgi:hypothetical protein
MIIKEPLKIDFEKDSVDDILEQIQYTIEQHPSNLKVIPEEEIQAQEKLNKLRKWEV